MSTRRFRRVVLTAAASAAMIFGLSLGPTLAARGPSVSGARSAGAKAKSFRGGAQRQTAKATVQQLPPHPNGLPPRYPVRPSPGVALRNQRRPHGENAGPKEYPQPVLSGRLPQRSKASTSAKKPFAKPGVSARKPNPLPANRVDGKRLLSQNHAGATGTNKLPQHLLPTRSPDLRPAIDRWKRPGANLRPLDRQHDGNPAGDVPETRDEPVGFDENEYNYDADNVDRDLSDSGSTTDIHNHPAWEDFYEGWINDSRRRQRLLHELMRGKNRGELGSSARMREIGEELDALNRELGGSPEEAFKAFRDALEASKAMDNQATNRPRPVPVQPGAESSWSEYDQYGPDSRFGGGQRDTTAGGGLTIYDSRQQGFAAGRGNGRGGGGDQGGGGNGSDNGGGAGGGGQNAPFGGRDARDGSVDRRNYGAATGAKAAQESSAPNDADPNESDRGDNGGDNGGGGDGAPEPGPSDGDYSLGPLEWNRNDNSGATVGRFLPDGDPAKGGGDNNSDVGPRIRKLPRYRPSGAEEALSPTGSVLPTTTGAGDEQQVQVGDRGRPRATRGTNDLGHDLRGRINSGAGGATVEGFINKLWWQRNGTRAQPPK